MEEVKNLKMIQINKNFIENEKLLVKLILEISASFKASNFS